MKMYLNHHLNHHRSTQNVRRTAHDSFPDTLPTRPVQVSEGSEINSVTVTAPCTTANLGPGFDVFALALEAFLDTVHIQISPGGVTLEMTGPDSAGVPADPELNTAGLVAK